MPAVHKFKEKNVQIKKKIRIFRRFYITYILQHRKRVEKALKITMSFGGNIFHDNQIKF